MDFHTLSRRELQTLCKKNKIPANITNVAMADALSALSQVEGLDEILNPREGGDVGTPAVQPRTACRTSTQRKPVSTRVNRGARAGVTEGVVEQENKGANVAVTPAVVPSSRRAPAVYSRRKKEVIDLEDSGDDKTEVQGKPADVAKTPAVAPTSRSRAAGRSVRNKNEIPEGTSVQKAYSTRRSVRLLGSSLSKMSLVETEDTKHTKIDDVSEEMSSVSQHEEASVDTEKGTGLQTESTVVSQNTDEVEVSSVNKADCESQSHDYGTEVKSTDAEDVLQAEPEEETSKEFNHVEVPQEDHGLNLQDSFETCVDSNEAGSKETFEAKHVQTVAESVEASMEFAEPEDASMEVADQAIAPLTVVEPEDASVEVPDQEDVADFSVEVSEEASKQTGDQAIVGLSVEASEESSEEIAHQAIDPLNVVIPDDACVDDAVEDVSDKYVIVSGEVPNKIADEAIDALTTVVVPNRAMMISSEDNQMEEVMEPKPEDSEQSFPETEKIEGTFSAIEADKDETSGDFGAEHEKESNEVEKVILQLSMLDVDVAVKKENQKDTDELAGGENSEAAVVYQINDQKPGDIVIESVAQSETKESANEIQAVPSIESGMCNPNMMKENLKTINAQNMSMGDLKKMLKQKLDGKSNMVDNGNDDVRNMSMRGLKKMLKLKLDGKSNMTDTTDVQMQDVEKKRTALQALPQNVNCDAQMAE